MAAKNGRNVSLTSEHDAFVDRLVQSGRYASASEVVREGLRLLERDEQARLLEKWLLQGLSKNEEAMLPPNVLRQAKSLVRSKIQEGLDAARRGELMDGDQVFRELLDRSRKRRATSAR